METKKPRINPIVRLALFILLELALLAIAVWILVLGIGYKGFYKAFDKVQRIPGLSGGFVPQGVTRFEDEILVCGYLNGGKASRLYRLDGDGGYSVLYMQKEDGSSYQGHAGGITAAGDFIYISNASKLFVLEKEDVLSAPDGGTVVFCGHVDVPCRASYCASDGDMVYVGEYHAPGYNTAEDHVIEVSDGKVFKAVTFGYKLSKGEPLGIEESPSLAFSTCDKVQGFTVSDDRAFLSCSAGFRSSKLRIYDVKGSDGVFNANGKEIPLLMLDSSRELDVMTMPNRSEDVEVRDGELYMAFEGGARKFGFGIFPFSVKSIMAADINKL